MVPDVLRTKTQCEEAPWFLQNDSRQLFLEGHVDDWSGSIRGRHEVLHAKVFATCSCVKVWSVHRLGDHHELLKRCFKLESEVSYVSSNPRYIVRLEQFLGQIGSREVKTPSVEEERATQSSEKDATRYRGDVGFCLYIGPEREEVRDTGRLLGTSHVLSACSDASFAGVVPQE